MGWGRKYYPQVQDLNSGDNSNAAIPWDGIEARHYPPASLKGYKFRGKFSVRSRHKYEFNITDKTSKCISIKQLLSLIGSVDRKQLRASALIPVENLRRSNREAIMKWSDGWNGAARPGSFMTNIPKTRKLHITNSKS
jgi:hypothetical protein